MDNHRKKPIIQSKAAEYSHLWPLMLWPLLFIRYLLLETMNPAAYYYPIYSPLDDLIPFHEAFLIPYVFWYVFIIGMHIYTLIYDYDAFKRYSKFLLISLSLSTALFILLPTCQNLRPVSFPRNNTLTKMVRILYSLDTNTNVCPSEHVICALAVMFTSWHCIALQKPVWIISFTAIVILICLSTVFLKQHSIIDVFCALPICLLAYRFSFQK